MISCHVAIFGPDRHVSRSGVVVRFFLSCPGAVDVTEMTFAPGFVKSYSPTVKAYRNLIPTVLTDILRLDQTFLGHDRRPTFGHFTDFAHDDFRHFPRVLFAACAAV